MLATRHSSPRWELIWWTAIAAHVSGCLASPKAANKLAQHLTLQGSLQPFMPCAVLGVFWGAVSTRETNCSCPGKVRGRACWGEQDDLCLCGLRLVLAVLCPMASVCLRAGAGKPGRQTGACLGVCWPSLMGRGTEWAGLLLAKTLSLPVRAAGLE